MAFQYIEGDFPDGTVAQWKEGNWVLVLPRTGLFKAPPLVMLRGQIVSVEVIKAGSETDLMSQLRGALEALGALGARRSERLGGSKWIHKGGAASSQGADFGKTLFASLGSAMSGAFGAKEVAVLCVLEDGKFFLANVVKKNHEWLENQVLMRTAARRFRGADFAEATMALCALMSALHGWVDGAKKARVSQLIESDETLKTFPAAELETKFAGYCRALLSNSESGRRSALEAVSKLAGKEEPARAAVGIAVSLAGEAALLDAMEQKLVREVCALLEIYPGEFGLFYSG